MVGYENGNDLASKMKSSCEDVRDMICTEEVRIKDYGEFFGMGMALSVDYRSQGCERSSSRSRSINRG